MDKQSLERALTAHNAAMAKLTYDVITGYIDCGWQDPQTTPEERDALNWLASFLPERPKAKPDGT